MEQQQQNEKNDKKSNEIPQNPWIKRTMKTNEK